MVLVIADLVRFCEKILPYPQMALYEVRNFLDVQVCMNMIVYTWNGLSISMFVSQNNNIEKVWLVPLLFVFYAWVIDDFSKCVYGSAFCMTIFERFNDFDPVARICFLLSLYVILDQ